MQDSHFVRYPMVAFGGNIGPVQFVDGCSDTLGQIDTASASQQPRGSLTNHLLLKPHPEARDHSNRLRHGNSIIAFGIEAGVPNALLQPITLVAEPAHARFSDERHFFWWRVWSIHSHIVFNHTTPPRL